MKLVHSCDIYKIVRDVLKLLDPKVINHGERTAYILYKMLLCMDRYEMFEIAEFCFIATMHDIGAFKTDYLEDHLRYESRDYMPHSIYGYLFLLYLTPFKDRAKIILYHHTDYDKVPKTNYEFTEIIHALNVAEKMDMYSTILGSKFDYMMFNKQADTKYSSKALNLLYSAQKKYDVFGKISSGEYKAELDDLFTYLLFTNEEKEELLTGIMSCISFRSDYSMVDVVACVQICNQLADKLLLSKDDTEMLYYAAILHDAGMCSVSKEVLEAPRKLTDEEMAGLRNHVNIIETILKGKVGDDILNIITAHHERCDGSGYPKRLKEYQMNRLQLVLQVADVVTALTSPRSYRREKSREEIISILKEEADRGKLSREVVRTFTMFYDQIMSAVKEKSTAQLSMYRKLSENYEITFKSIK